MKDHIKGIYILRDNVSFVFFISWPMSSKLWKRYENKDKMPLRNNGKKEC